MTFSLEAEYAPCRRNHVFRAGEVVIRVAPRSADVSSQVALARWLLSEGFHVAAPLADADVLDGAQLSLWEYVNADVRRPIDFEQLGEMLAPPINTIINAGSDPTYAAEAKARMRHWLGDPAAPAWTPL